MKPLLGFFFIFSVGSCLNPLNPVRVPDEYRRPRDLFNPLFTGLIAVMAKYLFGHRRRSVDNGPLCRAGRRPWPCPGSAVSI